MVGVPSLIGAIGAMLPAVGAAGDTDWLTITGGVILALGVMAAGVARHRGIDYGVFSRLDKLEKWSAAELVDLALGLDRGCRRGPHASRGSWCEQGRREHLIKQSSIEALACRGKCGSLHDVRR